MSPTPDLHGPWSGDEALPAGFAGIAATVYQNDPEWLPEDTRQLAYLFSTHHLYFRFGKVWLGLCEGQARLAGFFNRSLLIDGERCAFFGYWETLDVAAPNEALFASFECWAREQGATRVYGPINFNTYGLYRLRTNDFGQHCFPGEPYNPEYYPRLMQALGYDVAHRYYSNFDTDMPGLLKSMEAPYHASLKKMGNDFELRPLTPDFWMERLEQIYGLSELVFQSNFAYTPINFDIFKALCGRSFINKAHPSASWVAIDRATDDIASMLLGFPHWGPLIRQGADPRLDPALIDYAAHSPLLPVPRMMMAKTAGTDPRYRGRGIYSVLMYKLVEASIDTGFQHYGAVLAKEDNLSRGMQKHATLERRYALYWKSLT